MSSKAKHIFDEFKEFISRGNVMDLAVGIIIGTAFTAIVNSLVNDIVMPAVGYLIGQIRFDEFRIVLQPAGEGMAEVAIRYGSFLQQITNFLIIAGIVFFMVKLLNTFLRKKKNEEPQQKIPAAVREEIVLLTEIRDLLKDRER